MYIFEGHQTVEGENDPLEISALLIGIQICTYIYVCVYKHISVCICV
jgi:hypothetical protein